MLIIDSLEQRANSKGRDCRFGLSFKYRCCRLSKFPASKEGRRQRNQSSQQTPKLTNFLGQRRQVVLSNTKVSKSCQIADRLGHRRQLVVGQNQLL